MSEQNKGFIGERGAGDNYAVFTVLAEPPSPEFAEVLSAFQPERDIRKPVSPTVRNRIDAAKGSWESSGGRRRVEEASKRAEKRQVEGLDQLNDEDCWRVLSAHIAALEESFADALEVFPPVCESADDLKGEGFFGDRPDAVIAVIAVVGLESIASCRRNMGAGRVAAGTYQLLQANNMERNLFAILQAKDQADDFRTIRASGDGRKTGQESRRERDRREIKNRFVDYGNWRKEGLTDPRCWERASKRWLSLTKKKPNGERELVTKDQARRSIRKEQKRRGQEVSDT
jgi:hypothetical protein